MYKVTLKGGTVIEADTGKTALGIAHDLGAGLFRAACAAKRNGEVRDLRTALTGDCTLEILTFEDEAGRRAL